MNKDITLNIKIHKSFIKILFIELQTVTRKNKMKITKPSLHLVAGFFFLYTVSETNYNGCQLPLYFFITPNL